ncbi:PREDICTED: protein flightless-1-like [Priapulus caudatus]|uniref:Protein flightless-1-like n=1 Tax=Priapulus caudatus TaxID=37621 RepID=A0ABM1EET0_PRICU|nr:PREDICTED: protein flightless-1-like [Priapulus caudatus]
MAATGVLPFVRGIDFTRNDFKDGKFPSNITDLSSLRWLRINKTNLDSVPYQLRNLSKLEHLSLVDNDLTNLRGDLASLSSLRVLNARHNKLKSSNISSEIFALEELTVVDFSQNELEKVPSSLENAKAILVLNLSHNNISTIPNQLFVNCVDILYLDLSYNKLETLPPQLRRLINLQTLVLDNNPMEHFQLRQLPALTELTSLSMRNTQRTNSNIPEKLDALVNLIELDLSYNEMNRVPDGLFSMCNLKRLNLGHNRIREIGSGIEVWSKMEVLNVSWNKMNAFPPQLCKLTCMKRLYLNSNEVDFEGIPSGIGKLHQLEVFMAADNNLEMIPEGLCRCGKLQRLILNNNRLVTLPEAVHLLTELKTLDVRNNKDLVMPPKPMAMQKGAGLEYYNIDFSLSHQLRLAGAAPQPGLTPDKPKSDPLARKMRLRRRRDGRDQEPDSDQKKILKGFTEITKKKQKKKAGKKDEEPLDLKPKKWKDELEKPALDYSDFFEEDVGQIPGVTIWEIENFVPNQLDEVLNGTFYEGDCYIVLQTVIDEQGGINWQIYYWIGNKATLDKKACSAIHAVHLRNFLGAETRTVREEQGDESDAFLDIFVTSDVSYIEGARTASGFFTIEDAEFVKRLYRCSGTKNLHLEAVDVKPGSLDSRYVYLLDMGKMIYIWYGTKSKSVTRSKTRLLAEKINKNERKNESQIVMFQPKMESFGFWDGIGCPNGQPPETVEAWMIEDDSRKPILYKVGLGMGYLELPQVEIPRAGMSPDLLDTKGVYILDCISDLFVWIGKKSTRLVRAAALKLSQEILNMIQRPATAAVTKSLEGWEISGSSKTKVWAGCGRDVDSRGGTFRADAEGRPRATRVMRDGHSVMHSGSRNCVAVDDITVTSVFTRQVDLSALFMPRQPAMTTEEADALMEEWNEDLDGMEAFVLEGKKFVRLPEEELGHFQSGDCYVFLCRYWVPRELDESEEKEEQEQEPEDDYQCVVYFWQGRDASNMGWLTFTFSLQKKFESLFGEKLEVVRMHQQQENLKFLSHFKRRFVIHQGKRKEVVPAGGRIPPKLYHLRANGCPLCMRCIQVTPTAFMLNSEFCYIMIIPFDNTDTNGIIYVWEGNSADPAEITLAEDITRDIFNKNKQYTVTVLEEGQEPENFFWVALGGKKAYETVYVQNMRVKQRDRPRKLLLTLKTKESRKFTKCFHGWGKYKKPMA